MWALDLIESVTTSGGLREEESAFLACEDMYRRRFRHWRGRSGRAYVFSVYRPEDCPAYEGAVLMVSGAAGALACVDLGALPEARLSELRRLYADSLDLEFQIHVLAERQAERRALIADLSPAAA